MPRDQPGNYRKELFEEGSAKLFEKKLFEACRKCEWFLHAYVIMSDQYHFAVETPEGNPVEGMRWLQGISGPASTFCAKSADMFFNLVTRVCDRGGETAFGTLNYIHLNPVRRSSDCREVRTYQGPVIRSSLRAGHQSR